jgi:hypothetical protein
VLLGDVIELRHGPMRVALQAAQETLEAIGAALPAGAEVVLVPGNHDHRLVQPALERRGRAGPPPPLGTETAVDWRADEALATVARHLRPAAVRAAYPGLWIREDVYAFHGHYADRHTTVPMFERLAVGATARLTREPPGGPRRAEDYEAVLGPVYAWIDAVAQNGGPDVGESSHGVSAHAWRALSGPRRGRGLRRRVLRACFPALVVALNRAGLGPLHADISGAALRRASLLATADVLARLGVSAEHVIFGHTHRAGPLPGDDPAEFSTAGGGRLLNTGSWLHEPHFLGPRPQKSPYRPGFAVSVDADGPPQLRNLLDLIEPDRA